MPNQPLISVIIPCYNSAKYIGRAIEAVLKQTYLNLEIIIVDDNSTDNLRETINDYLVKYKKIRYEKLPSDDPYRFDKQGNNVNAGWSARNYGVELAKGELITFQDADDGSCSNRIEFQYNIMQEYNSHHVNVDWQQYADELNGKFLDCNIRETDIIKTEEILRLAKQTDRFFFRRPFGKNEDNNPIKKFFYRLGRKLFKQSESYPGAASMPLLKKEVFAKCHFRPLWKRTRPSWRGRGTDQDFNFWVAETFKDSVVVKIPLILWRVKSQNQSYLDNKYRPQ